MADFKFPSETVELPSKGLVYPKENPLSSGKVEVKYMTAKEEDILTNQNYIQNGTVLDKLLESVVISKINLKDLIIGDKNAILVATRILGYGKDYEFSYLGENENVDLTTLENKDFDSTHLIEEGKNKFEYTLPHSGNKITFKILNGHDEVKIDKEIKGLKKINKNASPELSTRLKYIITSIGEEKESKSIRDFVDNYLLARDSRALREYINDIQPDIDLTFTLSSGEEVRLPIGLNFFWPDA